MRLARDPRANTVLLLLHHLRVICNYDVITGLIDDYTSDWFRAKTLA